MTSATCLLALLAAMQGPATLEQRSRESLGWTLHGPGALDILFARQAPLDSSGWRALFRQASNQGASLVVVPAPARIDSIVMEMARAAGVKIALRGLPSTITEAIAALGPQAGLWATPAEWAAAGANPLAALSIVKARLLGGTLSAGVESEEFLKEAYRLDLRPLHWSFDEAAVSPVHKTVESLVSYHQNYGSRTPGARRLASVSQEEREKIEAAIPAEAPARPKKSRRLLVFDLNVGRLGHPSIPYANLALLLMGRKTGAFEAVISSDPAVLEPDRLAAFDAVFLNNTIGEIFPSRQAQEGFERFLASGGGLLANHAVTVTATSWPGFGEILGARGAWHRMTDETVRIRIEDPGNPIVRVFDGAPFEFSDEFFRFQPPYSRDRVRVLLSIDAARTDMMQGRCYGNCLRDDNDYAVAWVRAYGKGRVFYTTLGHNPHVFMDQRILAMLLAAAQYALGDLDAPDTPLPRSFEALDTAIAALKKYDFGGDREPVRRFEREMAVRLSSPGEVRLIEKKLIQILEGDAPLGAKETICRQLAYMGSEASKPILEAMLQRKETAEIARYALHGLSEPGRRPPIPPPAAPDPDRIASPVRRLHALAMANRRDRLPEVLSAVESPEADIRTAALRALADLGGAEQTRLLLQRAATASGGEQAEARFALIRMPSEDVDRALASGLDKMRPAERVEAVRALGGRGYSGAAPALLETLTDPDPAVRRESARALRAIARPEHATALLGRMRDASASDRRLYEGAIVAAVLRNQKPDPSPILRAYRESADPSLKQALLAMLGQVGGAASLEIVRAELLNANLEIQRAAARALSEWPTPEAMDDLLSLAKSSQDAAIQTLAVRGFVRLLRLPGERTAAESARLLSQLIAVSPRPDEKRLILSALQRFPSAEALELARSAEKDPAIAEEARNAAESIQRALSGPGR